jgi:hypothetical protein
MKKRLASGLVLGFLFAVSSVWARQSSLARSSDEHQQIAIGVYDYAKAGPGTLLDAERVTAGILHRAGVSISWLACPVDKSSPRNPDCADLGGPLKFTFHIVPDFMARRFRENGDVFGFAAEGGKGEFGGDAWVFYDKVKEASGRTQLSSPQILGHVMAHELGHLLLGANSHSRSGLMRARWSRAELLAADLGGLNFTDEERARIRNSMVARQQALRAAR